MSRLERPMPFAFRQILLVAALALLAACGGSGLETMRRQQALKEAIADVRAARAFQCAPIDLARAEANLSFAQLEMREGQAHRAREHLEVGESAVSSARKRIAQCPQEAPPPPGPAPARDSDGDGIVDTRDACPDQPEDFDGVEDEDGCPDVSTDRDGDGIVDELDRCPDQAEDRDGVEDDDGCPDLTNDRDSDGIIDELDRCPAQPEDRDAFQDEDGCPDVDNDADGLFDVVDRCPNEPEDIDGFEDQDGCPDADNDRDNIPDTVDRCPTEPETFNTFEDEDGCPDTKPETPSRVTISNAQIKISEQINFKVNSDVILPESFGILNDVATVMKSYPRIKVRIEGHTDDQGTEVYNLNLSKRRASSVLNYLKQAGIDAERMVSVGLGESQPLVPGTTPEARAANRRVEFHITEQ